MIEIETIIESETLNASEIVLANASMVLYNRSFSLRGAASDYNIHKSIRTRGITFGVEFIKNLILGAVVTIIAYAFGVVTLEISLIGVFKASVVIAIKNTTSPYASEHFICEFKKRE